MDPTKIQKASAKILTNETLEKAKRAGDKNAVAAIQKYMPKNTLLHQEEKGVPLTLTQK